MAVSKRLRFEVLRRDNHACRYCGRAAPEVKLTVDHVVPTTLGGTDDPSNLVAACADCNSGKSSMPADAPLVADVQADALRWAAALKRAAAMAMVDRDAQIAVEKAVWTVLKPVAEYMPADWYSSIGQFTAAGLTTVDLLDAANVAIDSPRITVDRVWRYFCGVCWRMVEQRQEAARLLLSAEDDA